MTERESLEPSSPIINAALVRPVPPTEHANGSKTGGAISGEGKINTDSKHSHTLRFDQSGREET